MISLPGSAEDPFPTCPDVTAPNVTLASVEPPESLPLPTMARFAISATGKDVVPSPLRSPLSKSEIPLARVPLRPVASLSAMIGGLPPLLGALVRVVKILPVLPAASLATVPSALLLPLRRTTNGATACVLLPSLVKEASPTLRRPRLLFLSVALS